MAEASLFKARPKFVDKVTKPRIGQLLDNLSHDHVVNKGEREWILEESSVREDMARRLIDTVMAKGDTACQKMIVLIQSEDPMLYSVLELSCDPPAPPAPAPQVEQKWSTTLIPTTPTFWRQNQNDSNIYPATKKSIGNRVALLITNIMFADATYDRHGAEKDEENMENHLTGLGYEVVKHTNLTGKAIDDAIIEFSKHPKLRETDSVVVIIMSHGKLGVVHGVNHSKKKPDEFYINNIYKHLNSMNCPALLDKPKIIIIQACRGEEEGSVHVSDDTPSAGEEDIEDDVMRCVHKEKDFICLLSSTPDTRSYRRICSGSFLIRFFMEVSNTFAHRDDIEELFRRVMRRFEEDLQIKTIRQMATKDRCSLTKRFYFYPGIQDMI